MGFLVALGVFAAAIVLRPLRRMPLTALSATIADFSDSSRMSFFISGT